MMQHVFFSIDYMIAVQRTAFSIRFHRDVHGIPCHEYIPQVNLFWPAFADISLNLSSPSLRTADIMILISCRENN